MAYIREQRCRVGALSHFDELFPSRIIAASKSPAVLRRAPGEPRIRYSYGGQSRTLDQYLNARPVTGLLIAKDDSILVERYQYGRTDKHRLTSFSMAKTIVGLLIGIAVNEGAIRSIDDLAEVYVPGLKIRSMVARRSGRCCE
jgi:CubicO group peptidase (beta-lactamase class C family)